MGVVAVIDTPGSRMRCATHPAARAVADVWAEQAGEDTTRSYVTAACGPCADRAREQLTGPAPPQQPAVHAEGSPLDYTWADLDTWVGHVVHLVSNDARAPDDDVVVWAADAESLTVRDWDDTAESGTGPSYSIDRDQVRSIYAY